MLGWSALVAPGCGVADDGARSAVDSVPSSPAPIATNDAGPADARSGAVIEDGGQDSALPTPDASVFAAVSPAHGVALALNTNSPSRLFADPVTPGHLLVGASSAGVADSIAVEWRSGAFGPALRWLHAQGVPPPPFAWEGGGIDGTGRAFVYACCAPFTPFTEQTDRRLMVTGANGAWIESPMTRPPGATSWPPRFLGIAPSTTRRVLFGVERQLWDVDGISVTPSDWPLATLATDVPSIDSTGRGLAFTDHDSALAIVAGTVRRCELGGGVLACNGLAATGIAAADLPRALWSTPFDAQRIYATTSDASFHVGIYASLDGGVTFAKLALPAGMTSVDAFAVDPHAPDAIVVHSPLQSLGGTLYSTKDRGATWSELAFPVVKLTSLQGIAFDAASDLYMVYGNTLYRAKP